MEQNYSYRFINNCSGNGEYYDNSCYCEVQYSGEYCEGQNVTYSTAMSLLFFIASVWSVFHLLVFGINDYRKMKAPSLVNAMKVTTPKAICLSLANANAIRGFVHFMEAADLDHTPSLTTAHFPFLLTASFLVICSWAEIVHVRGIRTAEPRFLKKSILVFMTFNTISYSFLLIEFLWLQLSKYIDESTLASISKEWYAALTLLRIGFFLFRIAKIVFMIRGKFTDASTNSSSHCQSGFGIILTTLFMIATEVFIVSDALGIYWKYKVSIPFLNFYEITFRIVELIVAFWLPSAFEIVRPMVMFIKSTKDMVIKLWQLWILNLRKILRNSEEGEFSIEKELENVLHQQERIDEKDDKNLLEEDYLKFA